MFRIISKEELAPNIFEMVVEAPRVAKNCLPGQFVILCVDEGGERIPLTICDYDRAAGTITIVAQIVGATSLRLCRLEAGDSIAEFVGPLGKPSEFCSMPLEELRGKRILFVAGGVGAAPVYPQVKWLREQGVGAEVILGAKNKSFVILEEKMKKAAAEVYVTTDDGSYGRSGMVTKCIDDLIAEGRRYDDCVAIGPMIMMKFCCLTTKKYGIHTIVSMNPIMVDGTGMCGACRLMVGGQVRFACVDGPEFDGHLVDFDRAMKRSAQYKTAEGRAFLKEQEGDTHHGGCGNCGGERK